jgi:hypothetical protein
VVGTPCVYETQPGATLGPNRELSFVQGSECVFLRAYPMGKLMLTIQLARRARIAVWTYRVPSDVSGQQGLEVSDLPGGGGYTHFLAGKYVDALPDTGTRRVDLLGYVWGGATAAWIWRAVAVSIVALFVGLYLVATPFVIGRSAGAAFVVGAIALLWAVLTPPLQAADEPDHVLSLGPLIGANFGPDLRVAAQRSHFDRIVFHPDEHFRPIDRERPYASAWSSYVDAEDLARRSALVARLWRTAARALHLGTADPVRVLLSLRLVHVLILAGLVGLSAFWIQAVSGLPRTSLWLLAPGIVPTLPYFAAMVSDWALVTSLSILWSTAVLGMWNGGRRTAWHGMLLGLSFGLLAATSLAMLPLIPLLAAILGGRVVLEGRDGDGGGRQAVIFWGGVALGLSIGYLFVLPMSSGGYFRRDATPAGAQLITAVNRAQAIVMGHPWLLIVLPAVAGGLELMAAKVRWPQTAVRVAQRGVAGAVVVAAIAVAAVLIASPFIALPMLGTDSRAYASARDYAGAVLATLGTGLRLSNVDVLTHTTFWSGFGWLETKLPDGLLAVFSLTVVAGLVLLVRRLNRTHDYRRMAWLVVIALGSAASAYAYAIACYYLRRNVSGRYLFTLYLAPLFIILQGFVPARADPLVRWRPGLHFIVMAGLLALHAFCIAFLLKRFF